MDKCVFTFYSKSLNGTEQKCIDTCVDKYVKHLQRVKQRFEEQTAAQMQQQQEAGAMPFPK
jgi:import inner membrane translocase subunit TIM9